MLNQKGGVGKTSCCHHLAGALAAMGSRVLLIDADPQSSLSQGFYGPEVVRDLDPRETVVPIFAGHQPFPSQLIRPSGIERIDLVPGSRAATVFNVPEPELAAADQQKGLRRFVDEVMADGAHDLVLIDCPPNLHLCSFAALVASDHLIVPLQPEDYGSQGIADVRESFELVKGGPNPDLTLAGYLLTMVARTEKVHQVFEATLRETYGADVFTASVPRLQLFKEAIALRKPVSAYKPKSPAAQRIKEVAEELLVRMDRLVDYSVLSEVA